ncbi:MAG TPA: SpoIID/LytB domain-containing protein [Candidatus Latescibacteria bacterium]|nr:SpoIID/LytB domain-containing protein [Candidatus Latescibacterota bacterium]
MKFRKIKYLFIPVAAFLFFGGIPVEFGTEGAFFHGFMIPKPIITIGLGTNLPNIRIRSSSGMKIYEVDTGYKLIADDADEVQIKGGTEKITEKYVILLAHAKEREEADLLAADFKSRIGGNVSVAEDSQADAAGVFEVKLGDFLTRGDALAKVAELNAAGLTDIWIAREDIMEAGAHSIWMLIADELKPLGRESSIYFIPGNPQSFLSLNGRSYRGFLIMKGSRKGNVLTNVVNLEDYLKSVVPGELSPGQFNALEALKAQAVAARTYALKNMGQYKQFGFDLVNTPRSQLYVGMSSEHPISTRAVDETKGEVMRYRGELINALYTSTCGGKTEDVENVFSGRPAPYLKSVECTLEKQPEWQIEAKTLVAPIRIEGQNASLSVSLLLGLGIVPMGAKPLDFRQDVTFDEAVEWIKDTRRLLGRREAGFVPDSAALNFIGLARLLVEAFGWQERTEQLLLPGEVDFLLKDVPQVQGRDRGPMAYCMQSGLIPISVRTGNPLRAVSRAELAMALARIVKDQKDFFQSGTFRAAGKGTIEVGQDFERKTLALSNHVRLLRTVEGETTFATKLTMLGGENVRWLERDGQVAYLEVLYPPNSNSLDRFSRFNRWQVRKTRQELEALINASYPIGGLADIQVKSRGASGRVIELAIDGVDNDVTVRGFQIRAALGLRDTLFVVDRTFDEAGRVESFTFSGRGWGHGVGLCQVGAYGMALAGSKYQDILKKYYLGIKFDKIY